MRKAGKQEGRNEKVAVGDSSRLLDSCLPAFLDFISWKANPNDVCAGESKTTHAKAQRRGDRNDSSRVIELRISSFFRH
jgi:hypothetical protein